MTPPSDKIIDVSKPLKVLKLRSILNRTLNLSLFALIYSALLFQLTHAPIILISGILMIFLLGFIQLTTSQDFKNINEKQFLLHLNRCDGGMEESAQLLLKTSEGLTTLQKLQRQKILPKYQEIIENEQVWKPQTALRARFLLSLFFLVSVYGSYQINLYSLLISKSEGEITALASDGPAKLLTSSVIIAPPKYTGLYESTIHSMDIYAIDGSLILWNLTFSKTDGAYSIKMRNGTSISLEKGQGNHYSAESKAIGTTLYSIIHHLDGEDIILPEIYTIAIERDQNPSVRVLSPTSSIIEIERDGDAILSSSALVSDDFGISNVDILTSVAKGSGEGVKFRDQVFTYDRIEETSSGNIYHKTWDLVAIGMEPGDEAYFTFQALDNREPEPNMGKSGTIIIRWLDKVAPLIAAEGIVIDLAQEYFKSQRQIIIETEELITDKDNLEPQSFKTTSFDLGRSQRDLKQKYGQYLGDEFGESLGEKLEGIGIETGGENSDEEGHGQENTEDLNDKTGSAELLSRFGHAHEEADIGPIAKQDPKTHMKRAVNIMWQAERHLMQGEPTLALPFEYEAMKYLSLAKQADRIYVQRLGFEPPPVTEERRLQGELDEIKNAQQILIKGLDAEDDQYLFRQVFNLLYQREVSNVPPTEQEIETLQIVSLNFIEMGEMRPVFINYAATIEKILMANSFDLENCKDCILTLSRLLWNMMDQPIAPPSGRLDYYLLKDPLIQNQTANGGNQ